jgi:hypothetical protein
MANVLVRCPRCTGRLPIWLAPALSRTDKRTQICGACARVEGHLALAGLPLPQKDTWPIRLTTT